MGRRDGGGPWWRREGEKEGEKKEKRRNGEAVEKECVAAETIVKSWRIRTSREKTSTERRVGKTERQNRNLANTSDNYSDIPEKNVQGI